MAMMSKLQAAYFAGLIDGEGYIGILKVKRGAKTTWANQRDHFFIPVLKVAMTDKPIVEHLYRSFGGTFEIRKARENAKESYCWTLRKARTVDFLRCIYPFLKVKQQDADIILTFSKTNNGAGHSISDEMHAKRTKLYEEIRGLHARGAAVETK